MTQTIENNHQLPNLIASFSPVLSAANGAEVPSICRFIICSRAANREKMWKKISSPFAVHAIAKSMS